MIRWRHHQSLEISPPLQASFSLFSQMCRETKTVVGVGVQCTPRFHPCLCVVPCEWASTGHSSQMRTRPLVSCAVTLSSRLFSLSAEPAPLSSPVFLCVRDAAAARQLLTCLSVCLCSLLSAGTTVSSQKGKTLQLPKRSLPLCVCVCILACISNRGHTCC